MSRDPIRKEIEELRHEDEGLFCREAEAGSIVWRCHECDEMVNGSDGECMDCQPWGDDPERPRWGKVIDLTNERRQNREWTRCRDAGARWLRDAEKARIAAHKRA